MKRNWLDSVVTFVNPVSGLKRTRARAADSLLRRGYEASSKGRRTDGWISAGTNASGSVLANDSIDTLWGRSRDLCRNNPYGARYIQIITNNVVGYGIHGYPNSDKAKLQKKALAHWKSWSNTTACDFNDRCDFAGLQELALRTVVESGSAIVLKRYTTGKNSKIPLQIQILEPDHLDRSKDIARSAKDGGFVIGGVEFDKKGKRIGYWLFQQHPGDQGRKGVFSLKSDFYEEKDVLHLYRSGRAGQVGDVPWLTPVMLRLHDIDKYQDAALLKQQIAACFAAFVKDVNSETNLTETISDKIEPAAIQNLGSGQDVTFANPPSTAGHSDYLKTELRSVAAGCGVMYESLTGDLENVNFSAGRLGFLEFQRNVYSWQWVMFIPQFCTPVSNWFLDAITLLDAEQYTGNVSFDWTPPPREAIDPIKEMTANEKAVDNGFKSRSEVVREQGKDPESHYQELAKDAELAKKYGLVFKGNQNSVDASSNTNDGVDKTKGA